MKVLTDDILGEVVVRHNHNSRHLRASVAPNGKLTITVPRRTPDFAVKAFLRGSRSKLKELLDSARAGQTYSDGTKIGKLHSISVRFGTKLSVSTLRSQIIVTLPESMDINDNEVQSIIRTEVIKALRKEAKNYLPKRLAVIASKFGYKYQSVRLPHAGSRWGSCSSNGTISLNIALMKLPHELIDYVLVHELAHTKQMNHSSNFWDLVGEMDSNYRQHKKALKAFQPIC